MGRGMGALLVAQVSGVLAVLALLFPERDSAAWAALVCVAVAIVSSVVAAWRAMGD